MMLNAIVAGAFIVAVVTLGLSLGFIAHWLFESHLERVSRNNRDGLSDPLRVLKHGAQHRRADHGIEDGEANTGHRNPDEQDEPERSRINHAQSVSVCPVCENHTLVGVWCAWCDR